MLGRVLALALAVVTLLAGCTDAGSSGPSGSARPPGTAVNTAKGGTTPGSTDGATATDGAIATGSATTSGSGTASGTGGAGALATGAAAPAAAFPPADVAAIRATIDSINATAGGPVAEQRTALQHLAVAGQAAKQRSCPPATGTIRFDPAYPSLRRAPVPAGDDTGTEYLLPAFITIYSGGRITGTDLTTLHVWVQGGMARTAALCVS